MFGESLVAAYLHGSVVLGGLRPVSDIDVMAVVSRATLADERRSLRDRLMPLSGPPERLAPLRPVEVTVVRRADVNPWRYPPRMEAQFGEWLRPDYERGLVPDPAANADLAPLLTVTLMCGRALVGPPAADVLAEVPKADLRRALIEGIAEWTTPDKVDTDTRNMLLALARTWQTMATGEIATKDVAAEWAAVRLGGRAEEILRLAGKQYQDGDHGEWEHLMPDARAAADMLVSRAKGIR